jgi:hypothetical protein
MSYSDGTSGSLNEAALSEAANIGRGATGGAYADWNLSGTLTAGTVSRNLNVGDSTDTGLTILTDYNDWANLTYPFARYEASQFGARMLDIQIDTAPTTLLDPIRNDRQAVSDESPPSDAFFEQLRNAR